MNAILQPLAGTVSEPSREPGLAGAALDQIFIEGLTARTVIGIHDNELRAIGRSDGRHHSGWSIRCEPNSKAVPDSL